MRDQDIHQAVRILRQEVKQWVEPIVGHYKVSPFKVLISCLLSLRTQDKTTAKASQKLFNLAQTPLAIGKLSRQTIERAIYPVGFYHTKAKRIKEICALLLKQFRGKVPADLDTLLTFPGVGRKTANLVMTVGFHKPGICVDTHVHRICNRWGYVKTKTPEQTEWALRKKLPKPYWIPINDLLVTFGQNFCRPISPFCSQCKLKTFCARVGVGISR